MGLKENIKHKRYELGLTLEDVAKVVGVSRQTIQKYENGIVSNIPSDKIELLAKALKSTPAYLMGWEETINSNEFKFDDKDKKIISAYHAHPEVQHSVDLLLGIAEHKDNVTKLNTENEDGSVTVWAAARSTDDHEPGYRTIDKDVIERLKKAKPKKSESEL